MYFPIELHYIWNWDKAQTGGCPINLRCVYLWENTGHARSHEVLLHRYFIRPFGGDYFSESIFYSVENLQNVVTMCDILRSVVWLWGVKGEQPGWWCCDAHKKASVWQCVTHGSLSVMCWWSISPTRPCKLWRYKHYDACNLDMWMASKLTLKFSDFILAYWLCPLLATFPCYE